MYLLKQLEHHHEFHNDRQQINNARKEAEALFRSKPRFVEPSLPADPLPTEVSVRKPKILSASSLPITRTTAEAPINSNTQPKPPVSVSQRAHAHRERLNRARAAIFKQQGELQERQTAIDSELRALDAYEAKRR
jgi:hypothetical protein